MGGWGGARWRWAGWEGRVKQQILVTLLHACPPELLICCFSTSDAHWTLANADSQVPPSSPHFDSIGLVCVLDIRFRKLPR